MSAWFLFYIGALFILQEWRVKFIKKYENEAYYRNFLDIRFVLLGLLINHYYKKKILSQWILFKFYEKIRI